MKGDTRTTAGRLADLARRAAQSAHPEPPRPAADTARERIELVLDEGSFTEIDALRGHLSGGVVTGFGTVDGRPVCVYSRGVADMDEVDGEKIIKIIDHATAVGAPLIGLHEGSGVRLDEGGLAALGRSGEILRRAARASGVIPQISLIMGTLTGVDSHLPAMADFVIMVDSAGPVSVTDMGALTAVAGENISPEDLGSRMCGATFGTVDVVADEDTARDQARRLLCYLPQNNLEDPPVVQAQHPDEEITDLDRELDQLIPDSPGLPYDMRTAVMAVVDEGELCTVGEPFAPNIVCGFGRIDGRSVGVVANQPLHLAGCLDIDAARQAARFVRTCDAFNLPVVTFVDAPGFVPSVEQEQRGLVRHSAQLIFSYAEATVPLITVITRAAYGSAYVTMASKSLGADVNLAWPTARIAVTNAQAAVGALHEQEIADHETPETRRAELMIAYEEQTETPYPAAERGDVDVVIPPHRTRLAIGAALRVLRNKRAALPPKKHGNIPL